MSLTPTAFSGCLAWNNIGGKSLAWDFKELCSVPCSIWQDHIV